jgi:CheY-like chemotaxis protein/methyl-accepting chemotaxis protein
MGGHFGFGQVFENWKIRAKLLAGFTAVLAILLAISATAVWSLSNTRSELDIYSQRVKVAHIADQLDRGLLDLRRSAREFAFTGHEDDAVQAKQIAVSIRADIDEALKEIKDPARRQRLHDLGRRFDRYMTNFERIHKQGEEQRRLLINELDPLGEQLARDLVQLQDNVGKAGQGAARSLAEAAHAHGLSARLYANQMLGRRDASFGAKTQAEFHSLGLALDGLERSVKGDALQAGVSAIKGVSVRYRTAFDRMEDLVLSNYHLVDDVNARLAEAIAEDAAFIRDTGLEEALAVERNVVEVVGWSGRLVGVLALVGLVVGGAFTWLIGNAIARPVVGMTGAMGKLAAGELDVAVPHLRRDDEIGAMARATQTFKEAALRLNSQSWVKTNVTTLAAAVQATDTPRDFARVAISTLMPLLGGGAGVAYLWNEETQALELEGSWGFKKRRHLSTSFKLGEGIVGQCAIERTIIILTEVPDDYVRINSGTGEATPRCILVAPVVTRDRLLGVIEIASFHPFTTDHQALIDEALPVLALNLEVQDRNHRTRLLLEQTQQQAEELRASEEELKAQSDQLHMANDELRTKSQSLEEQTEELRASEEELKVQREELQAANEELSQKTEALEEQAERLGTARVEADQRALERDTASRYKSEFLANMSHELRTPLNSLLILSRSLADNEEGNLSDDQVDSARIISESGNHLLRLINDILDLSKVEAGKMVINAADLALADFGQSIARRFGRLAEAKNLALTVTLEDGLPSTIRTDGGKLDQIINNLVGNALKFTETGGVTVTVGKSAADGMTIKVVDTGIGIPADKLGRIFVAFEQVDGSASRAFGGTGLGLTISRKLAQFLGGDIVVESELGRGSTFTLTLPMASAVGPAAETHVAAPVAAAGPENARPAEAQRCEDDRDILSPKDEAVLIVEDDPVFARIVRDAARKQGFKSLVAQDGGSGIQLARRYRPTGIILDVGLPGMDGWTVMEALKKHPETRHIPVHFMSAADAGRRGLEMGAVGFFTKPVTKEQIGEAFLRIHHFSAPGTRRLLLVEDDAGTRKAVQTLLAAEQLDIVEAKTGEEAIASLRDDGPFDCMILDLGLPGMDGQDLLKRCSDLKVMVPPVVVYSARDLSDEEVLGLREYTDSVVIKGARSPDRLLDEVTLFLHSVQARLPDAQQRMLRDLQKEGRADGAVVLVVDDDMRNTFALSKVLRQKGFRVLMAQDGRTAVEQLHEADAIDIVLMDIMMPGMDGYETTREIRKQERFRSLPIIALTAKAMVGDREKCLAAGADDYVSKPVDIDILLAAINRLVKRS